MHELALCDAMLKMVRDISREQALAGVRSITVRVGTLSGVVPRFLTDVEDLSCPDCGGKKLMPLSGRDMTIQEIEAY